MLHGFGRADGFYRAKQKVQEANEQRWAEAAQAVLREQRSEVA
jgi:hypothetical protein